MGRPRSAKLIVSLDPEDEDLLRLAWRPCRPRNVTYAQTTLASGKAAYLHRLVAARAGIKGPVDHENGDGLDCRRNNLRQATHQQNAANSRRSKGSSRFKGVALHPNGKWRAYIRVNYRQLHLGHFESEDRAALAYNLAAKAHFGKYALLNELRTAGGNTKTKNRFLIGKRRK